MNHQQLVYFYSLSGCPLMGSRGSICWMCRAAIPLRKNRKVAVNWHQKVSVNPSSVANVPKRSTNVATPPAAISPASRTSRAPRVQRRLESLPSLACDITSNSSPNMALTTARVITERHAARPRPRPSTPASSRCLVQLEEALKLCDPNSELCCCSTEQKYHRPNMCLPVSSQ